MEMISFFINKNMKVTFDMVRYMWEEGLKIGNYKNTEVAR